MDFDAIIKEAEVRAGIRRQTMPDETVALQQLFQAYLRLDELGWKPIVYAPKDGTHFRAIEAGSTGIFDCWYVGEWPDGRWWIRDGEETFSSHPILFKLKEPADATVSLPAVTEEADTAQAADPGVQ